MASLPLWILLLYAHAETLIYQSVHGLGKATAERKLLAVHASQIMPVSRHLQGTRARKFIQLFDLSTTQRLML
jgi:hypothetical protein